MFWPPNHLVLSLPPSLSINSFVPSFLCFVFLFFVGNTIFITRAAEQAEWADWETLVDEESGRTYYKNTVTGELQWADEA